MTCSNEQNLCTIAKGDKITLPLKFVQPDTSPLNISGMRFEMDFKIKGVSTTSLICFVIFPNNESSVKGVGQLILLPADTNRLVHGTTYDYTFRISNGPEERFTIGSGEITIGNVGHNPGYGLVFKSCCNTLIFEVGFASLPTYIKGDKGEPGPRGRTGLESIVPGAAGKQGIDGIDGIDGKDSTGGSADLLGLTDTPSEYVADAHQLVRVNAAANAVEFTDSINAGSF